MDLDQISKTVAWLEVERRKDKQEISALQERLNVLATEGADAQRKVQELQSELTTASAALQRLAKLDTILDGYRQDVIRQITEMEQRRTENDREAERLRKIEREGGNKSLLELRKNLELLPQLERDLQARKEEETRVSRLIAELQKKVQEFNRYVDERGHSVAVVEEGRRQDAKRITDMQTELSELRRRLDESRGKLELVEDLTRRSDVRLNEFSQSETERRATQMQWAEAQAMAQAERDRGWAELRDKSEAAVRTIEDYGRRVEQYAEVNRTVKQSAEDMRQAAELLERRIGEVSEMQRLAEERFRQEWAAFQADDQKRWTTHMLMRDEQWREHDRQHGKQAEHQATQEELLAELQADLQNLHTVDAQRMQILEKALQALLAEQDQNLTPVK